MGEVLSQNEIDSLLKALSSGELDVDEIKMIMKNRSKITILPVPRSSQKSICERLRLFLNIMEDCFQRICRCT